MLLRDRLADVVDDRALTRFNWLRLLASPHGWIEVLSTGVELDKDAAPVVLSGVYDPMHFKDLAKDVQLLELCSDVVHIRMNPVWSESTPRAINLLVIAGSTIPKEDVIWQQWLHVEIDSIRPPGCSATEFERQSAWEVADKIFLELGERGWPEPVVADAGNGFSLLFPIDLPTNQIGSVYRALQVIARKFDTPAAKVNRQAFNADQFLPLFGTRTLPGNATRERPHRQPGILKAPQRVLRFSEKEFEEAVSKLVAEDKDLAGLLSSVPDDFRDRLSADLRPAIFSTL